MKTIYAITILTIYLIGALEVKAQIWEQSNGPYGGSIASLALHPSGDLYAGFDGGLFRSTDNGDTWFCTGFRGRGVGQVF